MGEHGGIAAFEFELDEGWQQRVDFADDAAFVGFVPLCWHGEIDSIGIGFEQRASAGGEFGAHETEGFAAAAGDFIGGVDIGEAGEAVAGGEVAVGRIHDELHGGGERQLLVLFG